MKLVTSYVDLRSYAERVVDLNVRCKIANSTAKRSRDMLIIYIMYYLPPTVVLTF